MSELAMAAPARGTSPRWPTMMVEMSCIMSCSSATAIMGAASAASRPASAVTSAHHPSDEAPPQRRHHQQQRRRRRSPTSAPGSSFPSPGCASSSGASEEPMAAVACLFLAPPQLGRSSALGGTPHAGTTKFAGLDVWWNRRDYPQGLCMDLPWKMERETVDDRPVPLQREAAPASSAVRI